MSLTCIYLLLAFGLALLLQSTSCQHQLMLQLGSFAACGSFAGASILCASQESDMGFDLLLSLLQAA